jgi:hypothetical protein
MRAGHSEAFYGGTDYRVSTGSGCEIFSEQKRWENLPGDGHHKSPKCFCHFNKRWLLQVVILTLILNRKLRIGRWDAASTPYGNIGALTRFAASLPAPSV